MRERGGGETGEESEKRGGGIQCDTECEYREGKKGEGDSPLCMSSLNLLLKIDVFFFFLFHSFNVQNRQRKLGD